MIHAVPLWFRLNGMKLEKGKALIIKLRIHEKDSLKICKYKRNISTNAVCFSVWWLMTFLSRENPIICTQISSGNLNQMHLMIVFLVNYILVSTIIPVMMSWSEVQYPNKSFITLSWWCALHSSISLKHC